jgi:hypothetical protein
MKEFVKRPVGRPRTGKVKMMLSVAPEIKELIDRFARNRGLTRSAYIEAVFFRNE